MRSAAWLALPVIFAPDSAAQELAPCAIDGVDTPARCGRITVPEDYDNPDGRRIDLKVIVLPALASPAAPDPLFVISGGPGQAATDLAGPTARTRSGALAARDLVFVDQRGTGGSNSIACQVEERLPDLFGRVLPGDETLKVCLETVSKHADVRFYTTGPAVRDLEVVRQRLGYERINLSGTSYGTRVGLEFIRRFPEAVRAAVLTGMVPFQPPAPLTYAGYAQGAMDRVVGDCAEDPGCASAYPNLGEEWTQLVEGLRRAPAEVVLQDRLGAPVRATMSADDLGYTVRAMLYGPDAFRLPSLVHRAHSGDGLDGFAQAYAGRAARIWGLVSVGVHLSVFCSEDVPFIEDADVPGATADTYLGTYLVDEYRRACRQWPRGPIAVDFHTPVVSDVPVLLRSGYRDPSTPPVSGRAVLQGLRQGTHVVHRYGGHGFPGTEDVDCDRDIFDRFLTSGSTRELDVSCVQRERPLPFTREGRDT